jgi:hypothetical protein
MYKHFNHTYPAVRDRKGVRAIQETEKRNNIPRSLDGRSFRGKEIMDNESLSEA